MTLHHVIAQLVSNHMIAYRAAALILSLMPDIIRCFSYRFKFMNFRVVKMYGNNGTFYGSTKI